MKRTHREPWRVDHERMTEAIRQYRFSRPEGATDMLLIRHGESQPADPERPFDHIDGHGDPPLDPQGHREAVHVAERLADAGISAIYVTTLQRTQQTAAPLASRLGLQPRVEGDLREVHLGAWEGGLFRMKVRDWDPIAQEMFAQQRWDVVPGAEPQADLRGRVRVAITRIARAHPDERVAVVTHGGVIGTIVAMATGSQGFAFIGADNGSITHLVVADDNWIIRRFNDTGHLSTDLDAPIQPLT